MWCSWEWNRNWPYNLHPELQPDRRYSMSSRACKTKGGVVFPLKLWKTSLLASERIRSHLESSTTSRQHIWPHGKRTVVRNCAGSVWNMLQAVTCIWSSRGKGEGKRTQLTFDFFFLVLLEKELLFFLFASELKSCFFPGVVPKILFNRELNFRNMGISSIRSI